MMSHFHTFRGGESEKVIFCLKKRDERGMEGLKSQYINDQLLHWLKYSSLVHCRQIEIALFNKKLTF